MVRSLCTGALLLAVAGFSPAWGQQSPRAAAQTIVTVKDNGGELKCRLVRKWKTEQGGRAYQLQVIGTGEMLTVIEEYPTAPSPSRPDKLRALNMKIYHWGASTSPPPGVPVPPATHASSAEPAKSTGDRQPRTTLGPSVSNSKGRNDRNQPVAAQTQAARGDQQRIATVYENGRGIKCWILAKWQTANGFHAYQVQVLAGGERLTVVEDAGAGGADKGRSVRIYHWGPGATRSPVSAPLPPGKSPLARSETIVTEIKSDKPVILYESRPVLIDLDPATPAMNQPAVKPAGGQVVQAAPPASEVKINPKPGESVVCDCQPFGAVPARVPSAPLCQCEPAPKQTIDRLMPVPVGSLPGASAAQKRTSPYAPITRRATVSPTQSAVIVDLQDGEMMPRVTDAGQGGDNKPQTNSAISGMPKAAAQQAPSAAIANTPKAAPTSPIASRAAVRSASKAVPPPAAEANVNAPQAAPSPPIAAQAALNKPASPLAKQSRKETSQVKQDGLNLGDGPLDWRNLWGKMPAAESKQPGQSLVDPVASGTGPTFSKSDSTSPLSGLGAKAPPAQLPSAPPAVNKPETPATPVGVAKRNPPPSPVPPAKKTLPPPPMSITESGKQPDPLLNPDRYQPPVVEKKMQTQSVYVPRPIPNAAVPMPSAPPLGSLSVLAAQNGVAPPMQFVPVPVPTVPQPWRPPAPPPPDMPQAPQVNAYANAFSPVRQPTAPPPPQPGGAFATPPNGGPAVPVAYGPMPYGAYPYGVPAPAAYGDPRLNMAYAPLPQQPMYAPNQPYMPAPANWQPGYGYQPGASSPSPVTQVAYPIGGYQNPTPSNPGSNQAASTYASPLAPYPNSAMDRQGAYTMVESVGSSAISSGHPGTGADAARSVRILRDSIYPVDREDAAVSLGKLNLRAQPEAIQALIDTARHDPAGAVRAACVRTLTQQNLTGEQISGMLNALKSDSDPRVRQEVDRGLQGAR